MVWVEQFVVKHALCPFAALPLRQGRVVAVECSAPDPEAAFYWALSQVQWLIEKEPGEVETSLLVFPAHFSDFEDFLALVEAIEEALAESGADELIQLAHFHPHYVFADVAKDDSGNLTNRAPWGTVQLLRVGSVAGAVAGYGGVQAIPEKNIALMRKLYPAQD